MIKVKLFNGETREVSDERLDKQYWLNYGCFANEDHGKVNCQYCVKEIVK